MHFQAKYLLFPVNKTCDFTIMPVFPMTVQPDTDYSISILPVCGLKKYGLRNEAQAPEACDEAFFGTRHPLTVKDGSLSLSVKFPQEDAYSCSLYIEDTFVEKVEVYALKDDLFHKSAYKGDNHMHTYFSDGKDSPMYMAAACCRLGYDYCVITDHYTYEPSLLAKNFFDPTGVDFLILPGEEVHSPDNPVHIINLGGEAGVNAWFQQNEQEYRDAVAEEMARITEPMTDADRYAAAACQVLFDRIRAVNGVSVLCHPNWITNDTFNMHEDIIDYLFDNKRFDVLELIAGGAYEVGTQMQVSYYKDKPAMPVVGSSDTHNCFAAGRLEPGNYTIVFADDLTVESVKSAIQSGLTVAADANRFFGDYRLLKYAYFLQRNYFPGHKAKRNLLGASMQRYASAMAEPSSELADALTRQTPAKDFEAIRYRED